MLRGLEVTFKFEAKASQDFILSSTVPCPFAGAAGTRTKLASWDFLQLKPIECKSAR